MSLKEYNLINLEDTKAFAEELAFRFQEEHQCIVFLEGDLGVGKTTLVQYLLKNLGVQARVKSPTYTFIEPYQTTQGLKIYHIDLYRIRASDELLHLGLIDLLKEPALFFIEWPEQIKKIGIKPDLIIRLSLLSDGTRTLEVKET